MEYAKDILYLGWALTLLSVGAGAKGYFGWLLVPAYACYKGFSLLRTGRAVFSGKKE